jgi:hypothetical protein
MQSGPDLGDININEVHDQLWAALVRRCAAQASCTLTSIRGH